MNLTEIEARMAEIGDELQKRGIDISEEEIGAFEKEIENLKEERAAQIRAHEKRGNMLKTIAEGLEGSPIKSFRSKNTENESEDKFSTLEYRKAFKEFVTRGVPLPTEYRANEVTMTTDVSAIIPTTILNRIIEKLETVGNILALVTRTNYKGGVQIPVSTAKPVATWVAEGTNADTQKKVLGSISFSYHKLSCLVSITLETETMTLSAFESTLQQNVQEAMIRAIEEAIINGTGTGQPKGILAETPPTGQAVTGTPSYATLIAAESALPSAYDNSAVWCMNKKTFLSFIGAVDSAGQPIARVNAGIDGKPERNLLGRKVILSDRLSGNAGSGETYAFLFNFKDYVLNTNFSIRIENFRDNYTDDYIKKGITLVDGKVVDTNSLVTLSLSES
ncbi:MAG: phage major capsid protein [Clostridiales bacterium]|jgi:HK97 family phage major capsid protein|nr:phage major capsid protein [Clostridiales bacterium]